MKILFFFIFVSLCCSLPSGFKYFTCGFKLRKMHLETPFRTDWEPPLEDTWRKVLSQKFTYLDRGAQCYVFESQDHLYVLKLFRYDKKTFSPEKFERLLTACRLAYTFAKEETGLMFLHLNLTEGKLPVIQVKGPLGGYFTIPLDRYRFVLQRRATPFGKALLEVYHSGNQTAFKRRIDSFLNVITSRSNHGIRNTDPAISRNFAFLEDQAIEIDFGNYEKNEGEKEEEIALYTERLRSWLEKHAPEWVSYLDEKK